MELIKEFKNKYYSRKGSFAILFMAILLLYAAMLPAAHASSTLELVGDVPSTDGISIHFIEAMQVLDSNPNELFFVSKNQGADCGGGTPVSVWKMTLDPDTGKKVSVAHVQSLSQIQNTREDLFESSDGTLFTGGGWCGYKPAYYSTDDGNTWQTADSGPVYPPNSVFSFAEFNGDVYAGTGYDPYPGQVYRWLGSGSWELVLNIDSPDRNIVDAMVAYDNQLFVGSYVYWYNHEDCASTIPVLVSPDGDTFNPTTGIPPCHSIFKFLVVGDKLVTLAGNRETGKNYMYRWNGISKTWEEIAAYNIKGHPLLSNMASHNGNIYAYGQAPGDSAAGIYQSSDLGLTWQQIAVLENPDAYSMTIHDDTLYIGTLADTNNIAYIYRYMLTPLGIPATIDIDPDTLNLKSKGKWVTGYVELPEGYDVNDINVSTINLKPGEVPVDPTAPTTIGDYDSDGISDLMVKFNRANVVANLVAGNEVKLTVTGKLIDGAAFEGNDTIRVIE